MRWLARPVEAAEGLLPDLARLRLEPFGVAGILFIQQAVAERVLPGEVRGDTQLPGHLAGDDRVLVLAEHRLDPLHLPDEPAGLPADRRDDCLTCIAGAPGRLARLVQRLVPGRAWFRLPGPARPAGRPGRRAARSSAPSRARPAVRSVRRRAPMRSVPGCAPAPGRGALPRGPGAGRPPEG